jgi:hypothetical protein
VVNPASLTYKEKDKAVKQTGAIWTLALHKDPTGWHITAWSWSDGFQKSASAGTAP